MNKIFCDLCGAELDYVCDYQNCCYRVQINQDYSCWIKFNSSASTYPIVCKKCVSKALNPLENSHLTTIQDHNIVADILEEEINKLQKENERLATDLAHTERLLEIEREKNIRASSI